MTRSILSKLAIATVAVATLGAMGAAPASADGRRHGGHNTYSDRGGHGSHGSHGRYAGRRGPGPKVVIVRPRHRYRPPPVVFVYPRRPVYYHRVYKPYWHGRPVYYRAADPWFIVTALTLHILHDLNADARYAHRTAQIQATTVPVGQAVVWSRGDANGAVAVVRDGYSNTGEYCREFQNQVTIGGRTEQAFGTACLQPDGTWRKL